MSIRKNAGSCASYDVLLCVFNDICCAEGRVKAFCDVFFLMIRRPPRSTLDRSSAASDVYKRQNVKRETYLVKRSGRTTRYERRMASEGGC